MTLKLPGLQNDEEGLVFGCGFCIFIYIYIYKPPIRRNRSKHKSKLGIRIWNSRFLLKQFRLLCDPPQLSRLMNLMTIQVSLSQVQGVILAVVL